MLQARHPVCSHRVGVRSLDHAFRGSLRSRTLATNERIRTSFVRNRTGKRVARCIELRLHLPCGGVITLSGARAPPSIFVYFSQQHSTRDFFFTLNGASPAYYSDWLRQRSVITRKIAHAFNSSDVARQPRSRRPRLCRLPTKYSAQLTVLLQSAILTLLYQQTHPSWPLPGEPRESLSHARRSRLRPRL